MLHVCAVRSRYSFATALEFVHDERSPEISAELLDGLRHDLNSADERIQKVYKHLAKRCNHTVDKDSFSALLQTHQQFMRYVEAWVFMDDADPKKYTDPSVVDFSNPNGRGEGLLLHMSRFSSRAHYADAKIKRFLVENDASRKASLPEVSLDQLNVKLSTTIHKLIDRKEAERSKETSLKRSRTPKKISPKLRGVSKVAHETKQPASLLQQQSPAWRKLRNAIQAVPFTSQQTGARELLFKVSVPREIGELVADIDRLHHAATTEEETGQMNSRMKSIVIFSPGMREWKRLAELEYDLDTIFQPAAKRSSAGLVGDGITFFDALTVFAFSKAYVMLVTLWSATSFNCVTSPVLAALAGYSTLVASDVHGGLHLLLVQLLGLIQWLHGFCGVEVQALKSFTDSWSQATDATAGPVAQQLFAVSSAVALHFRYHREGDAQARDFSGLLQRIPSWLRKVSHQIACIVLISCGVMEATLATVFYLCAGIGLLVSQAYEPQVWRGIFVVALVIIIFKTAIYPLPEQAFAGWISGDSDAAENWNSWIQLLGFRACPQIQMSLVQDSDASNATADFEETTDCKAATMLAPYLVLVTAAIQYWWHHAEEDAGHAGDETPQAHSNAKHLAFAGAKTFQRCVFFVLLFSCFLAILLGSAARFIDVAVISALLFYLPFHLTLAGNYGRGHALTRCCGYDGAAKQILKLLWLVPGFFIIATVLLQYAATRDQLSCFLLYHLRDERTDEICPLIYTAHGSCNLEQVQSCIEDNDGCLRKRGSICMLTVTEAGLDIVMGTGVWATVGWLFSAIWSSVLVIKVHMSISVRGERQKVKQASGLQDLFIKLFMESCCRRRTDELRHHGGCAKCIARLSGWGRYVRAYCVLMAPNLVLLAVYIASQGGFSNDVNLIGFGYFVFLLLLVLRPSRVLRCRLPYCNATIALWVPLLLYSSLVCLAQYVWQLQVFAEYRTEQGKLDSLSGWSTLIGLSDLHVADDKTTEDADETSTTNFRQSAMLVHLLVIVSICVVRTLASARQHTEAFQDLFCGRLGSSGGQNRLNLKLANQTKHTIFVASEPIDTDVHGGWYYVREQGFANKEPLLTRGNFKGFLVQANESVDVDVVVGRTTLRVNIETAESGSTPDQLEVVDYREWLDFSQSQIAKVFLAPHGTPAVTIVDSDSEDCIRIRLNCPSVEFEVMDGMYARLPLPPYGAWLHMSRDDVCQFGKFEFAAANFLDIYGRFLRWVVLLIAAVSSSYSLSFLYLLSLAEMTVQSRTKRLAFSRVVVAAVMVFYLIVFIMTLFYRFSGLCADDWVIWCSKIRDVSEALMYTSQADSDTAGWHDVVHGTTVDFQGFLVLLVGGGILNSDRNTRQRIEKLHEHEIEVARRMQKSITTDAAWLTRAMARVFFLSDVNVRSAFGSPDQDLSSAGSIVSRGVMPKQDFCKRLKEQLRAQACAGLLDLRNADGSETPEDEWLDQITKTVAEDYKFPGALTAIEIRADLASARTKVYKLKVTADEPRYDLLLPESVTSFSVRAIAHEHTALKLIKRDEQCELVPKKSHRGIRFVGDKAILVISVDEGIEDGVSHGGSFGVTVRRGTDASPTIVSSPRDDDDHRDADEVVLRGICQKKKAHLRNAWRERHVRIKGAGLFIYENDERLEPRASSIPDVSGYQIFSSNTITSDAKRTWYYLDLHHDDRSMSLRFREKHSRNMFADALQNLSKGRAWNGASPEPERQADPEPEPEHTASDVNADANADNIPCVIPTCYQNVSYTLTCTRLRCCVVQV